MSNKKSPESRRLKQSVKVDKVGWMLHCSVPGRLPTANNAMLCGIAAT